MPSSPKESISPCCMQLVYNIKGLLQLLNTIDSLTKVSDALCGVAQSSEGQLNCSPMSMDSKKEEELFRSIISRTPSPFQFSDETSEGSGVRNIEEERGEVEEMEEEEEEEEDEELMGLLRGGGNTISALVLHRPEKWSKEKLRKWVNQRKRKKLKEFTALRSSKGARVRRTPERSPGGVKVHTWCRVQYDDRDMQITF